jgi:hypothetical protein
VLSENVGIKLLHYQHLGWNHHGGVDVGPYGLPDRLTA